MTQPNIVITQPPVVSIEIVQTPRSDVVVNVAGPQGPPGVQNVVISPTPPANPFENMIWIETFS